MGHGCVGLMITEGIYFWAPQHVTCGTKHGHFHPNAKVALYQRLRVVGKREGNKTKRNETVVVHLKVFISVFCNSHGGFRK